LPFRKYYTKSLHFIIDCNAVLFLLEILKDEIFSQSCDILFANKLKTGSPEGHDRDIGTLVTFVCYCKFILTFALKFFC